MACKRSAVRSRVAPPSLSSRATRAARSRASQIHLLRADVGGERLAIAACIEEDTLAVVLDQGAALPQSFYMPGRVPPARLRPLASITTLFVWRRRERRRSERRRPLGSRPSTVPIV